MQDLPSIMPYRARLRQVLCLPPKVGMRMQVTEIRELDKKRSRVYVDEEFAFVLYKSELRKFRIKDGEEITAEEYDEITRVILPKRAKLRAMNLLKSRQYSEKQLRDKLRDGEYPPYIIDEAVDYVSSYNYINDRRLAEEYIRIHISDKSKNRIKQDLIRKGISGEDIKAAFDLCADEGFGCNEEEQIKKLLDKRGYSAEAKTDPKEWNKQYAYLIRKGYGSDAVRKVLGGRTEEF